MGCMWVVALNHVVVVVLNHVVVVVPKHDVFVNLELVVVRVVVLEVSDF